MISYTCRRTVVAVVCVLFCVLSALPADYGKYTGLINKVAKLPSESIVRMGDESLARGRNEEAMVLYMVVCERADDAMPERGRRVCSSAYLKAGDIYYGRGDYTRALEFYVSGLKVCEGGSDKYGIARFYKNIGNVYCQFQDFEKGARYFKTAYEHCKADRDVDTERKLLTNLTAIYIYLGKTAEARRYQQEAAGMTDGGDKVNRFIVSFNGGLITAAEGRYGDAVAVFRRLAAYAVAAKLPPQYECYAYQELYKAFRKAGMPDSTLHYLSKCELTARRHGVGHMFVDALKDASEIYEGMGRRAEALEYKARFLEMSDSVFNQRKFDAVKNVQFQYEMEKTDKEITTLRLEQERSRQTIVYQRTAMAFGFAAMLVVTAFLVILYRQNRKLNSSYAGLYALNRDFISRHEAMNKRHADDMERMAGLEAEAEGLRKRLEEAAPGDGGEVERKYKSSNLNDEQQQALAEAIAGVMENGEEYCSDDFSLDRLAALVGSNSKYVSQVINGTYHKNFSNYVNEYRVRTACKRLADDARYGNLTVKAVGESVGYRSHATFVNIFKKTTGLTPSLYQKMARTNGGMDK